MVIDADDARTALLGAVRELAQRATAETDPQRVGQLAAAARDLAEAYGLLAAPARAGRPPNSDRASSPIVRSLRQAAAATTRP